MKEKDKQLHAKEKEIAEIRRKCAQLEASEEKLKFELQIERKTRSPPVSAQVKGLDTKLEDETTGERVSPTMVCLYSLPPLTHSFRQLMKKFS